MKMRLSIVPQENPVNVAGQLSLSEHLSVLRPSLRELIPLGKVQAHFLKKRIPWQSE
ncbi:MAG: hypothetical protein ACP5N0_09760 [Methanosarcina sp.]